MLQFLMSIFVVNIMNKLYLLPYPVEAAAHVGEAGSTHPVGLAAIVILLEYAAGVAPTESVLIPSEASFKLFGVANALLTMFTTSVPLSVQRENSDRLMLVTNVRSLPNK